jgi:hypothetical protein
MEPPAEASEFDRILEELGYELTAARSTGLDDPEALRRIIRHMRELVANADQLVGTTAAERLKSQGFSGRAYDE